MGWKRRGHRSTKAATAPPPIPPLPAQVGQDKDTLVPPAQVDQDVPPKSVLYLFFAHYPGSSFSYTLYKINLQDDVSPTPHQPLFLSPILQLPGYDRFATGIRCALLDSKFYLLGGEYRTDHAYHHNPQHHWDVFPRHVYQFDIATNGPFKKMDAPLNTGKPGCCVFAAAGKIYALGTKLCPNLSFGKPPNKDTFLSQIKLFECFDPITNQWQVLPNPPVDESIYWMGYNVLEHSHQVVLCCSKGGTTAVLVYHLQDQRWSRYANPCPLTMKRALYFQEAESPDHVYFLPTHQAPVKLNLDIMDSKFDVPSRGDGLVEMSVTDNSTSKLVDIFRSQPYVDCQKRLLRYLGDGHFCYANYGMLPHPNGPDRDGWLTYDPCARGITITLFKEISHDDNNVDGNSTTKSGGEKLGHSFQAQILHSQEYVMKSSSYNLAKLVGCFAVSPEPKAAAPVKKAPPTAKPAKVASDDHRDEKSSDDKKPKKMEGVQKSTSIAKKSSSLDKFSESLDSSDDEEEDTKKSPNKNASAVKTNAIMKYPRTPTKVSTIGTSKGLSKLPGR